VVTSIIVQSTAVLTVKTVNSGAITAISNTTPIKRSTAIVSSSDQDATANVKTVSNGGLAVDSQGNLSIAQLVGMSDGAIFNNNNSYLEVITRLDIDEGGRVTNIDKKEMQFKDGVQLKQNDNGTMQVQSDGLAVAMSIVFGG